MNTEQRIEKRTGAGAPQVFSKEFEELIAHELRTPLSSIMGFAEMMASDPSLTAERCQEFAKIIMREGKRLSEIVDLVVLHSSSTNSVTKKNRQYEHDLPGK